VDSAIIARVEGDGDKQQDAGQAEGRDGYQGRQIQEEVGEDDEPAHEPTSPRPHLRLERRAYPIRGVCAGAFVGAVGPPRAGAAKRPPPSGSPRWPPRASGRRLRPKGEAIVRFRRPQAEEADAGSGSTPADYHRP
jgi:hypothetical protein